ncbi:DUF1206 domain-containing protein [Oceaniglobus roseus]|uniref:DUF1206 domain-containing protein n=1 Tax=Oceaniglobus roseus TaxID=1737570 RepID=UPI000C7F4A44|nr:DUF1206 domain-containing protein [Kandeliimicrobium roseum]
MADSSSSDFSWALPVMRIGYLGRALVYLAIAGVSLWAIWLGGEAEGTSESLSEVESLFGGTFLLLAICIGVVCYGIWRAVDSLWDLEDYGTGAKGIAARSGMIASSLIHFGIGVLALQLLFNMGGGSSDQSSVAKGVSAAMGLPFGPWLVGAAGAITIGAGIYYMYQGISGRYRKHLRANPVTLKASPVLSAGLVAKGVIVAGVGGLLILAALHHNPDEAGGTDKVFQWAYTTPFGETVVVLICIGLLAFALVCLVNAIWRIVPKVAGPDVESVAQRLSDEVSNAVNG